MNQGPIAGELLLVTQFCKAILVLAFDGWSPIDFVVHGS